MITSEVVGEKLSHNALKLPALSSREEQVP